MPQPVARNPAKIGATSRPSSPEVMYPNMRARRFLSMLDSWAIIAPQAGLNAALPMSSSALPQATPTTLGATM